MEQFPEGLRAALARADEDYLTGLSNKGTVNRGKKDLQGYSPLVRIQGEEAVLEFGGETCTLRPSLGDSTCTCPSRGICRHLMTAILWAREQAADREKEKQGEESGKPEEEAEKKTDFSPLLDYPADKLKKILGPRKLGSLAARIQSQGLPEMRETSIVTVKLSWEPANVRLLVPVEHSACSCHSRQMCVHKAQALLCYQIWKGKISADALLQEQQEEDGQEEIKGIADQVCRLVSEQFQTGISRLPDSVCDHMEQMAALCHSRQIPNLERELRTAAGVYRRYFSRIAAYRDEELLRLLAGIYRRARELTCAGDEKEFQKLAGSFRTEYGPCPALTLTLLGEREFHGDSGYAGVIYYFWEMNRQQFYTYTWVRPVFYDQPGRRKHAGYHPAPWQLEGEMGTLYEKKLELQGGRASSDRRLSSSEQSRAVILGMVKPWESVCALKQYEDFEKMFQEKRSFFPDGPEADRVVLVIPKGYRKQEYDKIRQVFRLILLDGQGRSLVLEVKYRKEEERVVSTLEQFVRSLEKEPDMRAAVLGICYVEEGRLKLYPIEIYRNWGGRG
ncbi:MAG TPA: SWIM zinc finger family protein [Candidatus Enterocloster faecavium]|uniref:SWIM zinc finger family protein n=1 Tax=Candidatus Enterocloster faecavium TaxID=2838560 RepID=A0A9D2L954_9FIRM|nr:SWIM zinc finger family protein [Candidatus Enterocloster faecavium]